MEVRRQLRPARAMPSFGSRGVTVARVAQSPASAATLIRISPAGLLGRHRAPVDQVVLVIGGAGWVAGPDDIPETVTAGDIVRWSAGELHAAGSERRLTLLAHEARDLVVGELRPTGSEPGAAAGSGTAVPLVATRVARVTADLTAARAFYADGIGLEVVTTFEEQEAWSGVVFGLPDPAHQLELTAHSAHAPVVGGPQMTSSSSRSPTAPRSTRPPTASAGPRSCTPPTPRGMSGRTRSSTPTASGSPWPGADRRATVARCPAPPDPPPAVVPPPSPEERLP